MSTESFENRTTTFLQWFKSIPGAQFSDAIALQDLRGRQAGRGIVAVQDIEPQTTLFTIPRDGIMAVPTSDVAKTPELNPIFSGHQEGMDEDSEDDSAPDGWAKLILVMLYEYLLGNDSKWKPYFDVIPQTFDTPMFWSEQELEGLQASALRTKVGKESAETMFRQKVLPHVRRNPNIFRSSGDVSDEKLIEICHRMGSAIMAYAFDLDENDDEEDEENEDGWVEDRESEGLMGMVPMADMMNADAEFNAHVNHEEGALVVTSLRHIKAGEEILNYYGPHPNSELLRRYGYVTEKHSRYDVVEIPWQLVHNAIQKELGPSDVTMAKITEKIEELDFEDTFVLERETGEPNEEGAFTQPAQLRTIPEDLLDQLKSALKMITKAEPQLIPDKQRRDQIQKAVITEVLRNLLGSYATSLGEDRAILGSANITDRQRMTVIVRAGEKRLLTEALELLQQPEAGVAESEQSTKRQKTRG